MLYPHKYLIQVVHVMWEIQSELSTLQSGQINSFNIPGEQSECLISAGSNNTSFRLHFPSNVLDLAGGVKITIYKIVGTSACTNITLYLNSAHNIPY